VKDPDKRGQAARILFNSLEALRIIASELEPFMPVTSKKLLDLLNVDVESASLPPGEGIKPGHRVKPPVALFPRIGQTKA
jgi:methionyl-tRNA synthetase